MALLPSPSEALLPNIGTTGRLAVVIDQLLALLTALGGSSITPVAPLVNKITTGGTAVIVFSGPCKGGYITNPNAAGQGIAAENLNVDIIGVPGSGDANGFGTTFTLTPGQTYTVPALAAGFSLRANAATANHRFAAVQYT